MAKGNVGGEKKTALMESEADGKQLKQAPPTWTQQTQTTRIIYNPTQQTPSGHAIDRNRKAAGGTLIAKMAASPARWILK